MKIIVFILMLTVLTNCNTKPVNVRDSVIFTAGPEMNPAAPGVGIEVTKDTIFYTEGHSAVPSSFSYYYCLTAPNELQKVKGLVQQYLSNLENDEDAADVTKYQININNNIIRFNSASLNEEQYKVLNYIQNLKNCKLIKIDYHAFPTEVLQEQLPAPPPVVKEL